MAKCKGITKSGSPCKRNATQGNYCKSHNPDKDNDVSVAKPAHDPMSGFGTIFDKAIVRMDDPDIPPGVQVQWGRLATDCIRLTKEEQRLLDGIGDGVKYVAITQVPEDKPRPPVDDETPSKAVEDVDEKRVLN